MATDKLNFLSFSFVKFSFIYFFTLLSFVYLFVFYSSFFVSITFPYLLLPILSRRAAFKSIWLLHSIFNKLGRIYVKHSTMKIKAGFIYHMSSSKVPVFLERIHSAILSQLIFPKSQMIDLYTETICFSCE